MSAIDPLTLAVIQAGLQQVCNEMDIAFSRAAFSPVIAEADDRSDGNYAPDLDELLAPSGPPEEGDTPEEKETYESTIKATEGRVLNAIEQGVDSSTTPGRMPGGILNEEQAQQVSEFVARTAGQG